MTKKYTIKITGEASELIFKKLTKKEFMDFKEHGLPDSDTDDGLEFLDDLESSSHYFEQMRPRDISQFSIEVDGKDLVDINFENLQRNVGMKLRSFENITHAKEGKYILLCHRHCSYATWTVDARGKFDLNKFRISVNRYNAFGIFEDETIDLTYDGQDFEFNEGSGSSFESCKLISYSGSHFEL